MLNRMWDAIEEAIGSNATTVRFIVDGRDTIADRLVDEAGWLRRCSGWLTRLPADNCPPAVSLRPGGDHRERALVVTGLPRVLRS